MKSELQKFESAELSEILQSGELVVGLSSAIPGFIRKSLSQNAISFAPYYMRDYWVDLPSAIIREVAPKNGASGENRSVSIALRPGVIKEQVLAQIIAALAPSHNMVKARGVSSSGSTESGICCSCKKGDKYCVDCFLSL
jgi:hypothetical protein